MIHSNTTSFFEKLQLLVENKELTKLQLSGKRDKSSDLKKIIVTAVELKKGYCLNFVYRHNTKDITKNFEIAEGLKLLENALENDFYNGDIFAKTENINLIILPNGNQQIKTNRPTMVAP